MLFNNNKSKSKNYPRLASLFQSTKALDEVGFLLYKNIRELERESLPEKYKEESLREVINRDTYLQDAHTVQLREIGSYVTFFGNNTTFSAINFIFGDGTGCTHDIFITSLPDSSYVIVLVEIYNLTRLIPPLFPAYPTESAMKLVHSAISDFLSSDT